MMPVRQPVGRFDTKTGLWILAEDWSVELSNGMILHIRAGFASDGASIPRFLWRVCGPRYAPTTFAPALAHDALYAARLLPRARADSEFRRLLQYNGVGYFKAWSYFRAVRAFGWIAYRRHTPETIARARERVRLVRKPEGL